MPVNTSSTGATYGKSSDPLCPLGFHPQVRWPTRCKRCFRDYKEHSDSGDKKKYGSLGKSSEEDSDPWSSRRSNFQKSKSMDVTIDSSAASRFSSYTTTASAASASKAEEDIPEWKKALLDRRKKEKEKEDEDAISRHVGFIPGTTLHSSYVNKSYGEDSTLTSWGSASNLKSSSSYTNLTQTADDDSSYRRSKREDSTGSSSAYSRLSERKTEPEPTPYEKYLQRKKDQEKKDEDDSRKKEEEKKEEERRKDREKRREEEKKKEDELEKKKLKEKEKIDKEKEEERKRKEAEEESKKSKPTTKKWDIPSAPKKAEAKPTTQKWGVKKVNDEPSPLKSNIPEKPSQGFKSSLGSFKESSAASPKTTSFNGADDKKVNNKVETKPNIWESSTKQTVSVECDSNPTICNCSTKSKLDKLQSDFVTIKSRNEILEKQQNDAAKKQPMTFESAKASEATAELIKAREKMREQDSTISELQKERKIKELKLKELETAMDRRPQTLDVQKSSAELNTKLRYVEKKCTDLSFENEELRANVQTLEVELEEVQDNFREDEADEYRSLKRELENNAKNCRVLQFKLKKTEKSLQDTTSEKGELESKIKSLSGGNNALDNINKIRQLEKEIEVRSLQTNRLEAELKNATKGATVPRRGGPGPCLSRTGSVERNVEDQLLKDLQDSIERENDLKEQLNMAEDEAGETRKKLSRLEDENESLSGQVKRMTNKTKTTRRSPSPYNRNSLAESSEEDADSDPAELKVQLEVAENETGLLRKKVENLLTDNLKLTKEIKEVTTKLSDEKKRKTTGVSYGQTSKNNENDKKIDDLQTEVNSSRIKLIEKDRELERLDAQLKQVKAPSKTLRRSGSQDEDVLKKLNVIENEAEVLRKRTQELETEIENLKTENKKLQTSGFNKKPPASSHEKLQMDKFALEEKCKSMETKIKEANKKIIDLEESGKVSIKTNLELDRVKREKVNLETELSKQKDIGSSDKRRADKSERDITAANEKAEKAQRELIAAEREKRRYEEDKAKFESTTSRLESELRSLAREKERYKDESDQARQKNRDNLSQTQEGMKAFKEQIETLKQELSDEKRFARENKRQLEEKNNQIDAVTSNSRKDSDKKENELLDMTKKVKELEDKIVDIEEKWAKSKRINQQRKDKIDKMEKELENGNSKANNDADLKVKLKDLETKITQKETIIKDLETKLKSNSNGSTKLGNSNESGLKEENEKLIAELDEINKSGNSSSWQTNKLKREIDSLKQENEALKTKHELLEEDYVLAKAKMENNEISGEYKTMKGDYAIIKGELIALRQTYNTKSDEWIKEKLDMQQKLKDLEDSIRNSAGSGWDVERNRFKQILEDRDSQITNLKIECDVARSQHTSCRKELDDLKVKLQDYEKMSRFQKAAAGDTTTADSNSQIEELKRQISNEQRERTSDVNNIKMKADSKIAIMAEELTSLKSQASKYRRERETYKEMFEGLQKKFDNKSGKGVTSGDEVNELRSKVSDMQYRQHVLEDELSDAKMESSKSNAGMLAHKSNYEIQISELNSKINELEEEALIDSGRARIAGTRTKMELAWQKERESQKKLINELNTMSRDLKATLLEVEKEKEKGSLDSKRKIEAMKSAFDEELDDNKKQITDLHYDLLELRDAHAKLRTTNEKLRRDKDKSVDDIRTQGKSRSEYGEEKKIQRLMTDIEEFFQVAPKLLGNDIFIREEKSGRTSRVTDNESSIAKMEFKTAILRVKETKEELERIHKISEEEVRKRAMMRRGGSVESTTGNGDDSPRGRTGMRNASQSSSSQKRALYRKAVSVGDGMADASNIWQSKESIGSNESLASNASIPLPIPVRTRSTGGGLESGYSSDTYNAITIRRLERDTSVDRISTGSKESTQSEWLPGEKKKSKGLMGKLKKITRSVSKDRTNQQDQEQEFGSGSDISSASQQSKISTSSKMSTASKILQRARSASKDRVGEPKVKATPFGPPGNANAAFDKYFDKAGGSQAKPPSSTASVTSTSGSTLPRTYRRY